MSPEARWRVRVEDIVDAVRRVLEYTSGMTQDEFYDDQKTIDAVVRNIEIIGEAARHVPDEIQARAPEVPWAQMRGMRNVVIHEYDTVDVEIVWQTVQEDLPSLVEPLERLLATQQDDDPA
jgi:uncharacterized protein with HEPN domain